MHPTPLIKLTGAHLRVVPDDIERLLALVGVTLDVNKAVSVALARALLVSHPHLRPRGSLRRPKHKRTNQGQFLSGKTIKKIPVVIGYHTPVSPLSTPWYKPDRPPPFVGQRTLPTEICYTARTTSTLLKGPLFRLR